ncbi:nectin-1 isoform X1 [Acipenser ruthenus]|uniref:nectin-1 isoform X1 n=1 Tax=Acipenser ruthenus TaxID=7906 RepID=UPI0027427B19|nr:nectin-1 isoform X1 [Acipenser ruthenus]
MARRQHDVPVLRRRSGLITLVLYTLALQAADSQRVKVEPEVSSFPGQDVTLRCSFSDPTGEVKKSQVTWIRETPDGKKVNIAVFNPQFGASYPEKSIDGRIAFRAPSLQDPSIVLQRITMGDEGNYICEYATYPSGNEEGTTRLFVLAKPSNNATVLPVRAGPDPIAVARCVSANGKPPSEITWVSALPGNSTSSMVKNSDGTVTVTSEYRVTPSDAFNGKDLSCVIQHKTLSQPESFLLKASIEYPPRVVISGYDENWFLGREGVELQCSAKANPPATSVVWTALSGVLPGSVEVNGPVLKVMKVDYELNTTFICEANNSVGTGKVEQNILVTESPPQPQGSDPGTVAGAVIGCLLAVLVIAGLVFFCFLRRRKRDRGYRGGEQQGSYDPKTRVFGGGKNGGNNNGTVFTYREDSSEATTERAAPPPTAQDILLSGEMDTLEKSKFDLEADEGYDRFDESFGEGRPVLQLRPGAGEEEAGYVDDDMESQRDGSIISRTAVYV